MDNDFVVYNIKDFRQSAFQAYLYIFDRRNSFDVVMVDCKLDSVRGDLVGANSFML